MERSLMNRVTLAEAHSSGSPLWGEYTICANPLPEEQENGSPVQQPWLLAALWGIWAPSACHVFSIYALIAGRLNKLPYVPNL